jgi:hypothetical protein
MIGQCTSTSGEKLEMAQANDKNTLILMFQEILCAKDGLVVEH